MNFTDPTGLRSVETCNYFNSLIYDGDKLILININARKVCTDRGIPDESIWRDGMAPSDQGSGLLCELVDTTISIYC
ncbi:hypothetical protein, partial [Erythrobacter sp. HI0063]|uniref:hypothetical protein n=1 Tax=Erythrobacter sp. HI0063 TaxID=1822240 RepID=UPI001F39617A